MTRKNTALYFEIHKESTKPCGYIRSSCHTDGKVCHDTLARINGVSLDKLTATNSDDCAVHDMSKEPRQNDKQRSKC